MKNKKLFIIAALIFILDRVSKTIILHKNIAYCPIIPKYLSITSLINTGAAFSLFQGKQFLLVLISGLAILGFIYYFSTRKIDSFQQISWGLLIGGAFGNLYDRIAYHFVVDFINLEFIKFPVFNIADAAISIGAILIFYHAFFLERRKNG